MTVVKNLMMFINRLIAKKRGMNLITLRPVHVARILVLALLMIIVLYFLGGWGAVRSTKRDLIKSNGIVAMEETDARSMKAEKQQFILDGKDFTILSGAMHYFRIVPEYWKDRLLKLKAAGLNTVETYVPWNMHEQTRGVFQFEGLLNIRQYIKLAQELGLYVIIRPGPYICAEWDLGGLPSWLLMDPNMKLRAMYQPYLDAVDAYFAKLIPQVADLQYSKGGPIIAFQIENEYGSYGNDLKYMHFVKQCLQQYGITDILFTSDNMDGSKNSMLPGILMTANFQEIEDGEKLFDLIRTKQPDAPLMVMEFWTGWFDHWGEEHHKYSDTAVEKTLEFILHKGASVNFYMFHGGTNFGFMNGANHPYMPTVSSYDYDAPISEAGDLTPKYFKIKDALRKFLPEGIIPKTLPDPPPTPPRFAYGDVKLETYLPLEDMLQYQECVEWKDVIPMEMLPINNNGGQGYGFTVYRNNVHNGRNLLLTGPISDRATIVMNGREVKTVDWRSSDPTIPLPTVGIRDNNVLDIIVENLGRVNYANFGSPVMNNQRKGLMSNIFLDGKKLEEWQIFPLEWKQPFIDAILYAGKFKEGHITGPALYLGKLWIEKEPKDTFINMFGWTKSLIIINNKVLGRFWNIGPQKTLYVPAPYLHQGENKVLIFEMHAPRLPTTVTFIDSPILT